MRVASASLLIALALAMSGCALATAGGQPSGAAAAAAGVAAASRTTATPSPAPGMTAQSSPASPAAAAQLTHEVPTPTSGQTILGGWRSPAQAVQEFATGYINWSYRTVSAHLRALSQVSVEQARSMLSTAAIQVGHDYELRRGRIANRGLVEAIAPVRGRDDQFAVVTREQTTAANTNAYQGLAPAWHVALATVTRVRGLWVLSGWQPES